MSKKTKTAFVLWTEYLLFLFIWGIMRMLPMKAAYALADFCSHFIWIFDHRHWRRTVEHLVHAGLFPDKKSAKPTAIQSVRSHCRMFVEIAKADQCFSMDKVTVTGDPDTIRDLIDPKTKKYPNCIIIGAHYGNWEIAGTILTRMTNSSLCSIMRQFENSLIGKLILSHRNCPGHALVDRSLGIRPLYKALLEGKNISIIADQHASHSEGVEVQFFGHPARTHITPALLHLKTGIPICPAVTRRVPGCNFCFEEVFGPMIRFSPTGNKEDDVLTITQLCNDALEKLIRQDPEQWMWAPRRWLDADGRTKQVNK